MKHRLTVIAGAVALLVSMAPAAPAAAQASRTWVSGVGDDVNPCSRTAPCKTFAGALSKTAAGGEVNCIDPGGFGSVTITKSITLRCEGVLASALAAGSGITINAGADDTVVLSGLDIRGARGATTGVRVISAGTVTIHDSQISRWNTPDSFGVAVVPTSDTRVFITDTLIFDNGSGATGGGILAQPSGAGSVRLDLDNVNIHGNAAVSVRADSAGSTGRGVQVSIRNSLLAGSANGIVVSSQASSPEVVATVRASSISGNTGTAVTAAGPGASVALADSEVGGNAAGLQSRGGGRVQSFGGNLLRANGSDGQFTETLSLR